MAKTEDIKEIIQLLDNISEKEILKLRECCNDKDGFDNKLSIFSYCGIVFEQVPIRKLFQIKCKLKRKIFRYRSIQMRICK